MTTCELKAFVYVEVYLAPNISSVALRTEHGYINIIRDILAAF